MSFGGGKDEDDDSVVAVWRPIFERRKTGDGRLRCRRGWRWWCWRWDGEGPVEWDWVLGDLDPSLIKHELVSYRDRFIVTVYRVMQKSPMAVIVVHSLK